MILLYSSMELPSFATKNVKTAYINVKGILLKHLEISPVNDFVAPVGFERIELDWEFTFAIKRIF